MQGCTAISLIIDFSMFYCSRVPKLVLLPIKQSKLPNQSTR